MRELRHCRRAQMFIGNAWVDVHWQQLDEGDIIRIVNPDGTVITDPTDAGLFVKGAQLKVLERPQLKVEPVKP